MVSTNRATVASAGSGKTTTLVKRALEQANTKIAFTTYTRENTEQIKRKFRKLNGGIPPHVDILPWYTLLLHEFVRPYQTAVYDKHRIVNIAPVEGQSTRYVPKKSTAFYVRRDHCIYTDKMSQFALECNRRTSGLVVNRLEAIYDYVFIDEIQDMAGWDLDLIKLLLKSNIGVEMMGDVRQGTFATNHAVRGKKFRGSGIIKKLRAWEAEGICQCEELSISYRCHQSICDVADDLYPDLPRTASQVEHVPTDHFGVFCISKMQVVEYLERFSPVSLRFSKASAKKLITQFDLTPVNFGVSKGSQFKRVLILPTKPIEEFLKTGKAPKSSKSVALLYVAITRAKYSVAFVFDGTIGNDKVTPWKR